MTTNRRDELTVTAQLLPSAQLLHLRGVLNCTTYQLVRDTVIKAALDDRAVIVDVTDLVVPAESAWVVFTSAQWHVGGALGAVIALVSGDGRERAAIARNGVARYVAVYSTVEAAQTSLATAPTPPRIRVRESLARHPSSSCRSRSFVAEWLTRWSQTDYIPAAKVAVTVLVENALQHTTGAISVLLETDGVDVTVAVDDTSHVAAVRREKLHDVEPISGLQFLACMCRAWRSAPTPSGKTVWAVLGPENRL